MDSPSAGLRRLWYESWLSVTVLEWAAQRHLPGSPSGRPKGLAARTTQTTNSPTSVAECLSPNIWACNGKSGIAAGATATIKACVCSFSRARRLTQKRVQALSARQRAHPPRQLIGTVGTALSPEGGLSGSRRALTAVLRPEGAACPAARLYAASHQPAQPQVSQAREHPPSDQVLRELRQADKAQRKLAAAVLAAVPAHDLTAPVHHRGVQGNHHGHLVPNGQLRGRLHRTFVGGCRGRCPGRV